MHSNDDWVTKRYHQTLVGQAVLELALGLYFTVGVIYAASTMMLVTLPFLCLFQVGFLYMGLVSLIQQYQAVGLVFRAQVTGD